jgi:fucose permease
LCFAKTICIPAQIRYSYGSIYSNKEYYLKPYARVLILCNLSMMTMAIATNVPPVYFTTFSHTFGGEAGLTAEQLGRIGAFVFGGYVIGLLVSLPLGDRFGAKPFVLIGNALAAIGLGLIAAAINYPILLAAVLLLGIGAGIIELITSPIVSVLEPTRRTNALNMLHAFYSLGSVLTILLASLMIYFGVSWRLVVLGMAALPVFTFFGFIGAVLPPLIHEDHRTPLRKLIRIPFFLIALVTITLCGASELGMVQWLPAYAEQGLGFSRWFGGLSLMFFSAGMFIGRWSIGSVGHRFSPFVIEAVGAVCAILLILAGAFVPYPAAALAACIGVGLAVSCLWPTMLAIVAGEFPTGGASMFGFLAACGNSGGIVVSWLIGVVADRSSLRIGITFAAIAPFLLLILLAILAKHAKPQNS